MFSVHVIKVSCRWREQHTVGFISLLTCCQNKSDKTRVARDLDLQRMRQLIEAFYSQDLLVSSVRDRPRPLTIQKQVNINNICAQRGLRTNIHVSFCSACWCDPCTAAIRLFQSALFFCKDIPHTVQE